jgi:hypothetical protein
MIFSAPLFLYLLPAAGLPILFHFLWRQKKRQIVFPTLMFFYKADPKLHARRKLHQLLLLMMRVLLILLMLLALSRPRFQAAAGVGGRVSVVAVIDNSGSMSGETGGDQTKFELAVQGTRNLVASLGQQASMNIVTLVKTPDFPVGDALMNEKERLLNALDTLTPCAATGNPGRALTEACALIKAHSGAGGVVHVFSDLQTSDWAAHEGGLDTIDASVRFVFHRIASPARTQANVAISSIQFPQHKILPNHPLTVGVVCRNNSQTTATVRVNSVDNHDNKHTQPVVIEPGRTQLVPVKTQPDRAGDHWLRVWIEGDSFAADNEAGIGIVCDQAETIWFDGSQAEFGVLPMAFSPDGFGQFTGMNSRFGRITQGTQIETQRPILIVTTWHELTRKDQGPSMLQDYVQVGGNLLIVPSPSRSGAQTSVLDWVGASTGTRVTHTRGAEIKALDVESGFWNRLREATGGMSLGDARAFSFYPLALSPDHVPLLTTDTGQVLLAHKTLGRGTIYTSGTAFDPRWNTLPLTGTMVVLAQSMAMQGTMPAPNGLVTVRAGESPAALNLGEQTIELVSLVGDPLNWQGPAHNMPGWARAGVYRARTGNDQFLVSVYASPEEGLMQFVNGAQVPALQSIPHDIVEFNPQESFKQYHRDQRRSVNLFLPLVLLATLVLLVEGWLANPIRQKSSAADQVTPMAGRLSEAGLSTRVGRETG